MNRANFAPSDIDLELVFDRELGASEVEALVNQLRLLASAWSASLRFRNSEEDWIDASDMSAHDAGLRLVAEIADASNTRREAYPPPVREGLDRVFGVSEMAGANGALTVIVSLDELVLSPVGMAQQLQNRISIQIRSVEIGDVSADAWVRQMFRVLCRDLDPAWASACNPRQYWAQVMSSPPAVRALGRDFARFLPGIFWLNYFGRRLRERFAIAESTDHLEILGGGVFAQVGDTPDVWDRPGPASLRHALMNKLGTDDFFDRDGGQDPSHHFAVWADLGLG